MKTVVITRHASLVQYLCECGITDGSEPVITHATAADVAGNHVIGVLPLSLAAMAASVTEVPLNLTPEDRGKELPIERLREVAGEPVTHVVLKKDTLDEAAYRSGAQGEFWAALGNLQREEAEND